MRGGTKAAAGTPMPVRSGDGRYGLGAPLPAGPRELPVETAVQHLQGSLPGVPQEGGAFVLVAFPNPASGSYTQHSCHLNRIRPSSDVQFKKC